jgi:Flp pilus assembly protein TadG
MRRIRTMLRCFGVSEKGIAAVEFALLAPMMLFLLFGSVDLIDALGTSKRVENTAASLADVVSRDTEVSTDEVNGLWAALNILMFPDSAAAMDVRVTSVSIVNNSTARVVWSEARNGYAPLATGSTVTLQPAMMVTGTSLIMAETRYLYRPPIGFLLGGGINIRHVAYRRSRLVDPIPRV